MAAFNKEIQSSSQKTELLCLSLFPTVLRLLFDPDSDIRTPQRYSFAGATPRFPVNPFLLWPASCLILFLQLFRKIMRDLCEQKEADDNFMNAIQTLKKASLLFWKGFNVLVQEDEVRIVPETLCKLHKKQKRRKAPMCKQLH